MAQASSQDIDTSSYDDSIPPDELDDIIQTIVEGNQNFLNQDHYLPWNGTAYPSTANGAGDHRKVTFYSVITTPTVAAGKVELYTKTADGAPELHFKTNPDSEKQLTLNGALNLEEADFATIVDATSNLEWVSGVLTSKVDDSTIEYDGSNGLQSKVPAVDGASSGAPEVIYEGSYTGTGASNAISVATGVTVRRVVIRHSTDNSLNAIELINTTAGEIAWAQGSGTKNTDLVVSSNGFTVGGTANVLNASGSTYYYIAHCVRT